MSVADRYLRTLEIHALDNENSRNGSPQKSTSGIDTPTKSPLRSDPARKLDFGSAHNSPTRTKDATARNSPRKDTLNSPARNSNGARKISPFRETATTSPSRLSPTRFASPRKTADPQAPNKSSPTRLAPTKLTFPGSPKVTSSHKTTDVESLPTDKDGRKRLHHDDNAKTSLDQERKDLQAYEYLCHVGEAREWTASIIGEDGLPDVVDFPMSLVNGVTLAKITRHFRPDLVRRIFEHPRLQYRHTENINCFFDFLREVNMPDLFTFELIDLYEKRNIPKVIYCIHALSHILADGQLAPEMTDLVGKLDFTDDQLNQARKGLDDAGAAMPNFGAMNRHFSRGTTEIKKLPVIGEDEPLAREPTPEPIIIPKREPPAVIARPVEFEIPKISDEELLLIELEKHEEEIVALQAICRGNLSREKVKAASSSKVQDEKFILNLQSLIRGSMSRKHTSLYKSRLDINDIVFLQARVRANNLRREIQERKSILRDMPVTNLQSVLRGRFVRKTCNLKTPDESLTRLQALCRGKLLRAKISKIDRAILTNKQLVLQLQQASRAHLARRAHTMRKSMLGDVDIWTTSFQSHCRGALARRSIRERTRQVRMASDAIIRVQSAFRGVYERFKIGCTYDDLDQEIVGIVGLQARIRGYLIRSQVEYAICRWYANEHKIIKVQSMWRTKCQNMAYNSLIADPNPSLSTIKHFVHLLNDNEADYQEEINIELTRKRLAEQVKSNEQLEQYIDQMDTKIALLLKNKISLDEVLQHRRESAPGLLRRTSSAARLRQSREESNATRLGQKSFDLKALNKNSRQRLELYQGLFYILQTQPQYLAKFMFYMSHNTNMSDRDAKATSDIILTVFGNLSEDREEYFFLQLMSKALYIEMDNASDPPSFLRNSNTLVWRMYNGLHRRRSVGKVLRQVFSDSVNHAISVNPADLESDPTIIYNYLHGQVEYNSHISPEVAIKDPDTRSKFVANLQLLRELVVSFMDALESNVELMPYHVRYLAHQVYMHGSRRYDNIVNFNPLTLVGHLFINQFLNPSLLAADNYGLTETALNINQMKNIDLVILILDYASRFSVFGLDQPYLQPLNEFVSQCGERMMLIFKRLVDIPDLQTKFGLSNFDDMKNHQRPVLSIKTEDILKVHSLVFENMEHLADGSDNCIRPVLRQLGPLPNNARDILDIAKFAQVRLDLNPNYGTPVIQSKDIDSAGLMALAKRCLVYVLRVQKGADLMQVLIEPVEEEEEETYARILEQDQSSVGAKKPGELANLTYRELKLLTLEKILELESCGRVSRDNHYQELLNSLANDIRNKHELRVARVQELKTCDETLVSLKEKEKYLKGLHKTYSSYIDKTMTTLQEQSLEGNRQKTVFPFTRKFFQQRDLLKRGKSSHFGTYQYSGRQAMEKGILIHVKGYTDKQYKDLTITFSCDQVSKFNIEVAYKGILLPGASTTVTLDQLLEKQYDNQEYMDLFDDAVRFHTTRLMNFIFRKFLGAGSQV